MPVRGSREAPRFDSKYPRDIKVFMAEFKELAESREVPEDERFKYVVRYADSDARELWESRTTFDKPGMWKDFVEEVEVLYLGANLERYTLGDLHSLTDKYQRIQTLDELLSYHREMSQVSHYLVNRGQISSLEEKRYYLAGIKGSLREEIIQRLAILKPQIQRGGPYEVAEVFSAAQFVIQGAVNATLIETNLGTSVSAAKSPVKPEPMETMLQELRNMRQDMKTFMARETAPRFAAQTDAAPRANDGLCTYCRQPGHFRRECVDLTTDLSRGIVRTGANGMILTRNGAKVSSYGYHCLRDAARAAETGRERDIPPHVSATITDVTQGGQMMFYQGKFENQDSTHKVYALPAQTSAQAEAAEDEEDEEAAYLELAAAQAKIDEIMAKKKVRFEGVELPRLQRTTGGKQPTTARPAGIGIPATKVTPADTSNAADRLGPGNEKGAEIETHKRQYRFVTPAEAENPAAVAKIYDSVMNAPITMSVRDLYAVCPEVRRKTKDSVTTRKVGITDGTNLALAAPSYPNARGGQDEDLQDDEDQGKATIELRALTVHLNGVGPLEGVLDSGASFIAVHRKVWEQMGTVCRPDRVISLVTADGNRSSTVGLLTGVKLSIGPIELEVKAHVVEEAPFDILLGRPFYAAAQYQSRHGRGGEEIAEIIHPRTNARYSISTRPHDARNNKYARPALARERSCLQQDSTPGTIASMEERPEEREVAEARPHAWYAWQLGKTPEENDTNGSANVAITRVERSPEDEETERFVHALTNLDSSRKWGEPRPFAIQSLFEIGGERPWDLRGWKGKTSFDNSPLNLAYKKVANKVRPVPATLPEEFRIVRYEHPDPLKGLPILPAHPPPFEPGMRFTEERKQALDLNPEGFLTQDEVRLVQWMIRQHEAAFAWDETEKGHFKDEYFPPILIPTIEHVPWVFKNIPIPNGIFDEVVRIIKDKISSGIYEPSNSSYRSRWFCVVKKDGKSLRLVHDLQPLNGVSVRDPAVPPFVDQLAEKAAGKACYSTFDLYVAFDQRKLDPKSRDLTTFQTPLGTFRLTSIPMGYTNSFQIMHNDVIFILKDEIPHVANPYADDVMVNGGPSRYEREDGSYETIPENPNIRRFVWEHLQDVNRVLQRFEAYGATVSGAKTSIARSEGVIVGHRCTYQGRVPDESKVQKVVDWPACETVSEVRGFLGTVGVLRIFIKDFAFIARPLTNLTRKNVEFDFNEECRTAMDQLKAAVIASPALKPIDYQAEEPVILAVDSSNRGYGYIILQVGKDGKRYPNRFGSGLWNQTERNYSQPKAELYGLFRALKDTRIYIMNVRRLIVEVDAKYIKGMINNPDVQPNATINRWIAGILLFDFELVHVPAEKHAGPDGLSRRPASADDPTPEESDVEGWLDYQYSFAARKTRKRAGPGRKRSKKNAPVEDRQATEPSSSEEEVDAAQLSDTNTEGDDEPSLQDEGEGANAFPRTETDAEREDRLKLIKEFLTKPTRPPGFSEAQFTAFVRYATRFFVKDGKLWRKGREGKHQVVVDENRRFALVRQVHDGMGHKGVYSVRMRILDRFWWPSLDTDVKWYVRTCHECQTRTFQQIHIPPTVQEPAPLFHKLYIDTMHLPRSHGYKGLVQARCSLSAWAEWAPLRSESANALMEFIFRDILCRWGAVAEIVSDNGSPYIAALDLLSSKYGINHIRIAPYNSRANGIVERRHRDVREALMKTAEAPNKWFDVAHAVFWAERITVSRATGHSPFYLAHGVEPLHPFDHLEATYLVDFPPQISSVDLLAIRARQLSKRPEDLERARDLVLKARFKSIKAFEDLHRSSIKKYEFEAGDLVLVRNSKVEMELDRKAKPRYLGPYAIVRRTEGGAYVVAELDGAIAKTKIAGFRVIPYHPRQKIEVSIEALTGMTDSQLDDLASDASAEERTRKESDEERESEGEEEE